METEINKNRDQSTGKTLREQITRENEKEKGRKKEGQIKLANIK